MYFEFNDISKQFDKDPVAAVDPQIDLIFEESNRNNPAMDAGLSGTCKDLKECEVELLDGGRCICGIRTSTKTATFWI